MELTINIVYLWLVISGISITKCHYNLYNTDQNQNSVFYYDCLRYTVRNTIMKVELLQKFKPPSQIIPYCLRPVDDEFDNDGLVEGNSSSFKFDELNRMNVTAQDLIRWSIPFDLIEDYQEYLDTEKPTLAERALNNCSHGWFGLYCQYAVHAYTDFTSVVTLIFSYKKRRDFNELFPLESNNLVCYVQLKCDRCLDWREICDGKTDCSDDDVDEQNCFDLEMNECAEDEYRCQNGLCVPEVFLNDYPSYPDCLDSTDEQEKKNLNLRFNGYPDCFRDPAFRCEESQHPTRLQNFPCGDGETSVIFEPRCMNRRDIIHFQSLFSYEKNSILSFDCWLTLYCATAIGNPENKQCNIFCRALRCTYNLQDKCTSVVVFFPQQVILHNHIRFAYLTNKTIEKRIWQTSLLPDYVCYDAQRCPFLTPTLHVHGSACILTTALQVNTSGEIDLLFRTCPIKYQKVNLTNVCIGSFFQCPGTTKLISKHRLLDGIPDCYGGADETNIESCSLNHKHRFQCQSEKKCISPVTMYDYISDCIEGEDERRAEKKQLISFQEFCDGFRVLAPELIENENETDETNCEAWPCDNMYTHCDQAWSCFNGLDEVYCSSALCSTYSFPCILPYNFTIKCLPISRMNDGVIDCLGATDERSYCRSISNGVRPYRCWNDSECISIDHVYDENVCPFDNIESRYRDKVISQIFDSMDGDVQHVLTPKNRYFSVSNINNFRHPTQRTGHFVLRKSLVENELVLRKISPIDDLMNSLNPWKCNRGIPIKTRTRKNYRCFCPPSYYGDHCQFQSQRVSLTLQVRKICAPSCQGIFKLLVTLFDNKQVIHSQEQVTYVSTTDCNKKFNIYLLYNERPKNLIKSYTIRVDAYNRINISYYASWIFPVSFAFLPVNRISAMLTLPVTPLTRRCSKFCAHGQCVSYINSGKEFCLCDSGWSGEQCTTTLNCSCSSDSLCLGAIHNRSTCLCPLDKYGPRCLLTFVRQLSEDKGEQYICFPEENDQNTLNCICQEKFFGDKCQYKRRIELSFSQLIIPQLLLVHLIITDGDGEPERTSIMTKIKLDQDEAIFYSPLDYFHILFVQMHHEYYLLATYTSGNIAPVLKMTVNSSHKCPHIRELVDKRISSFPLLRRVKYYHMVCKQRSNLPCFHDEETFMCLCSEERHANCFHFDFNMTYDCEGSNDCKNGAKCFYDDNECPVWVTCVCPECFYGSKCQLSTKGFSLSLDIILGYSIRPGISLRRQPSSVKVSIAVTTTILSLGLLNSILSIMTFQGKNLRQVGCAYYLLASSIVSLIIMIIFTLKFIFLMLSQMAHLTNRTFLIVNCISMDFLLRSFLALSDWLNAGIAIERTVTIIKGASFNKKKSRETARVILIMIVLIVFGSNVHDPIYRQLVEDEEDGRIWCIVQYHSFLLEFFNSTMNVFHFILPFAINIVSALIIIITAARQRASAQKQLSYRRHLQEQWRHHNHLIISSIVLILLAVPRLIISFLSGCMKSARNPWLFLTGYFISYVPPLLTFVIYILPSEVYKNHFDTLVRQYRTALWRLLGLR